MAQLNKPCFLAQSEGLQKKAGKSLDMPLPEIAYGVMIGMSVCRNHPEGNVLVSRFIKLITFTIHYGMSSWNSHPGGLYVTNKFESQASVDRRGT
jgi:hypothetical protein